MALSGLDIYKLLPKTNCKKCGFQTCLAFAMQLAKRAVPLEKCPFVSEQVRGVLEEAAQPAIRLVEIGTGDNKVAIGNETVLFRHEAKFYHPTAIGIILEDDLSDSQFLKALDQIKGLCFDRVGQAIKVDLVALKEKSNNKEKYCAKLKTIRQKLPLALVLWCASAPTLKEALGICAQDKPLVYCSSENLVESFAALCKEHKTSLAVRAVGARESSNLTKKLTGSGLNDIVLDVAADSLNDALWQMTQLRRLAIKKNERSVGFSTMLVIEDDDPARAVSLASMGVAKYASVVLTKLKAPEYILPLLTLRQNIFTDPQKPLQVEPNIYPVGATQADSPVLVTTNFSLTYYTVLGEIESSRIPTYLICVDTEGMSVLTAWAAEKFTPEKISDTLQKFKVEEKVKHRNLIIPGYVSVMSGDLEEKSGWKIQVGPREASGLPSFLKNLSA